MISNPNLDWLYFWKCIKCDNYQYDFPKPTDQYLTVDLLDWGGAIHGAFGKKITFQNLFVPVQLDRNRSRWSRRPHFKADGFELLFNEMLKVS